MMLRNAVAVAFEWEGSLDIWACARTQTTGHVCSPPGAVAGPDGRPPWWKGAFDGDIVGLRLRVAWDPSSPLTQQLVLRATCNDPNDPAPCEDADMVEARGYPPLLLEAHRPLDWGAPNLFLSVLPNGGALPLVTTASLEQSFLVQGHVLVSCGCDKRS